MKESENVYGEYDVLLESAESAYLNYTLLNELMLKLNKNSKSNDYILHTPRILINDTNVILFDNQCYNFLKYNMSQSQTQQFNPYAYNCYPNISYFDVCNLTSKHNS